jgi:hypothetical protein
MAKRRGKSRKYKNRKRVSAGKRAYKKSGLYKYNMRRKKSRGKKRRKGRKGRKYKGKRSSKKSRSYARKAAAAGVRVPSKSKIQDAYRRIIDRGGSESHARAVVARLERMRMSQIRRGVAAHDAKLVADSERKKAAEFADLFRKIGAEEHRRASL